MGLKNFQQVHDPKPVGPEFIEGQLTQHFEDVREVALLIYKVLGS